MEKPDDEGIKSFVENTEKVMIEVSMQETVPVTAVNPGEEIRNMEIDVEDSAHEANKKSPRNNMSPKGVVAQKSPKFHSPTARRGSTGHSPTINPDFNCANFWKLGIQVDEIDDLEDLE
jgi:hypothetical protein